MGALRRWGSGGSDISQLVRSPHAGVFKGLAGPDLFAQAYVDYGAGTWSGELDLASERYQPYGARARQSLSDLCFGKRVEVLPRVRDRYRHTVAHIKCSGVDANTEQVKRGMAWVYRRYARDHNLYVIQHDARAAKRGLWADSSPVPPWEFRKQRQRYVRQV